MFFGVKSRPSYNLVARAFSADGTTMKAFWVEVSILKNCLAHDELVVLVFEKWFVCLDPACQSFQTVWQLKIVHLLKSMIITPQMLWEIHYQVINYYISSIFHCQFVLYSFHLTILCFILRWLAKFEVPRQYLSLEEYFWKVTTVFSALQIICSQTPELTPLRYFKMSLFINKRVTFLELSLLLGYSVIYSWKNS